MTDWNGLIRARELDIPPEAVEKFAPILDALLESFRPLLKDLPPSYTESE
jgi:hypothetical protein